MRNITVGIDVGTYQVKIVVAELVTEGEKKNPRIIGTGFAESKGLRHGYIVSSNEVTDSVRTALQQAEKSSGIKIHKAYLAVGGIGLTSINNSASVMTSRADMEISDLDIAKASQLCEDEIPTPLIQNRRVLHSIPLSYKVDGKLIMSKSPIGMKGTKLEIKMLFITALESHLSDILEAVENAGVEVIDCMASPLAGSFVTLTKSQKIAGCVLANIGAETISIVVFENNIPISLEVFQIGSTDITNDIALGLKIPLEEAENIKVGSLGGNSYSKKKLDEIVEARLSDMFELIENHLKKIGRNGLLPAGIIVSGGGASIGTIEDFAKVALRLPSRLATLNLGDAKSRVKDSTWAVAYGLCVLGFSTDEKRELGVKVSLNQTKEKVLGWIKQFLP